MEAEHGPWVMATPDLGRFRACLRPDLFDAFVRMFVFADRITSISQLYMITLGTLPSTSVGARRNVVCLKWLALGTLREAAHGVGALKAELAKRGWLDQGDARIARLIRFERKWLGPAADPCCRTPAGLSHADAASSCYRLSVGSPPSSWYRSRAPEGRVP